ncbi:arylamine N-acetyltransferase [Evansella cellulosilytica]|uniref:N-acetyltransferase n=1 Tax=Evansella cellulosilytica (strain ATCC 21833 / DSM 2522 / FERM P-1141 / JCM 9156 / N-4) TaxID=649639 RepID=E6TWE5_EVAC2|nr:arylamine N-acetyltransferase [Evansella cellulosilytica]ADU32208.1 N-acetyltransferase [Evansella cellulosilytica DSM 2522]
MENDKLCNKVLKFLSVKKEHPNLSFLNKIVKNHQEKIKWETLTKVIDWQNGDQTGQFLPSVDIYFERVINKGMGGTCWTHSVGLHWLLTELGFPVYYVYMDPGHICLRVELDEPYYVDVGYCAPLFQAYPMFESFKVKDEREIFDYSVTNDGIKIIRTPGPTKTLNPNPIILQDMEPIIKNSNNWDTSPVLREIQIFGYINGVPTSLKKNVLKQHFQTGKTEKVLNKGEVEYWVTKLFGIDKDIYYKALKIYENKMKI